MGKIKRTTIKELIITKKLLMNSQDLINTDSLENNLIAVANLNSALNIFLTIVGTQQKIESFKQLDNITLEKQWLILSKEYEKRFGQKLSMKTQIFTLSNIIQNFIEHDIIPSNQQVQELYQALLIFLQELTVKIFEIDFQDIDLYLLLDNPQVQESLKNAHDANKMEDYEIVLKNCSLAFHIAFEDQRQKINYLSEQGLLKPEPFMLDKSIKLHLDLKDKEFIHMILQTSPKKLDRFLKLIPSVLISEDDKSRPEITISDFVDEEAITADNAQFCLDFVLETILQWETLDLIENK
jgi:hypothetical protein